MLWCSVRTPTGAGEGVAFTSAQLDINNFITASSQEHNSGRARICSFYSPPKVCQSLWLFYLELVINIIFPEYFQIRSHSWNSFRLVLLVDWTGLDWWTINISSCSYLKCYWHLKQKRIYHGSRHVALNGMRVNYKQWYLIRRIKFSPRSESVSHPQRESQSIATNMD